MNELERYNNIVKPTTPRLVFEYEDQGDGNPAMRWAVVGLIPAPLLIAATIRAQVKLCEGDRHVFELHPETKFVIAWPSLDATTSRSELSTPSYHISVWFLHPHMPVEHLLTMIEVAKSTVMASMLMRQQQEKQTENRVKAYKSDGSAIN